MKQWIFLLCIALAGCATQKQQHEHQTHVINVDTLVTETQLDSHSSQHRQDIDSLVSSAVSQAIQEYMKTEQEHEVTTETLTETIDSLGRVVRQQQKTTDRTLSRQELRRQEQQIQEMKINLQRHIEMQDSAWAQKFSQFESHLRDSLDMTIDKQSVKNAAPVTSWWKRLWHNLEMILVGVVMACAAFVTRKWWIPWLKRLF